MSLNEIVSELAPGNITTVAGAGYSTGVPAKEADAGWPMGVVRRPDGEIIVTDYHGNRLWRIDKDGILHNFAGDGVPGTSGDGGPASEARFFLPHDLSQDRKGNLYLSDLGNQTYRRIDFETGIVTRVAGTGKVGRGGDGGLAVDSELDTHCGIAVDDDGNIFLSSEWANNVKRVDAKTGIIETFAGQDARHHPSEVGDSKPYFGPKLSLGGYHGDGGPASEAGFNHPEHLAFDSKGDLYICDNSNHRVRKIDMKTGIINTVLGNGQAASNGDGGPATEASTLMPDSICLDVHDNLYVGEKYGYRVRKVEAKTGIVTTLAGNGVPGYGEEGLHGSETHVNSCEVGIYADPDGTVFWGDCSGRLRRYDGETGIVTTVLGGTSIHDGEDATKGFLNGPGGMSLGPNGHVYIADVWGQRIRAIDPESGLIRTVAGNGARAHGGDNGPAPEAYLGNPYDVSVDAEGRVVIADTRHGHVRRVDSDGIIRNLAGSGEQWDKGDGGPAIGAHLIQVMAVSHSPDGSVYIGDSAAGRIRRIDAQTGIIDTIAGTGTPGYTGDGGPATAARVGGPFDICFDVDGNLYFADGNYNIVRRIDTAGKITTVAGTGNEGFSEDGTPARKARLSGPFGLAVAADGTLYVSDTGNDRVRKIGLDGVLTTVAGSAVSGDHGDGGSATEARLNRPHGLLLYRDDVLLISDHFNNHIRAVRLA